MSCDWFKPTYIKCSLSASSHVCLGRRVRTSSGPQCCSTPVEIVLVTRVQSGSPISKIPDPGGGTNIYPESPLDPVALSTCAILMKDLDAGSATMVSPKIERMLPQAPSKVGKALHFLEVPSTAVPCVVFCGSPPQRSPTGTQVFSTTLSHKIRGTSK